MLPQRGQSGPGSNGNEVVLRIPQSSSITEASLSDCLVSYPGHLLKAGSYPSAEMQLVYSTTPADWATLIGREELTHLQRCSRCILQPLPVVSDIFWEYYQCLNINSSFYIMIIFTGLWGNFLFFRPHEILSINKSTAKVWQIILQISFF